MRTFIEWTLLVYEHIGHDMLLAPTKYEAHIFERLNIGAQQRLHIHALKIADNLEFIKRNDKGLLLGT